MKKGVRWCVEVKIGRDMVVGGWRGRLVVGEKRIGLIELWAWK